MAGFYITLYKALGGGVECEHIPATGGEVRPYFPRKPMREKKVTAVAQPEAAAAATATAAAAAADS